ncbi:MAG: hypothetical protein HQL46_14395 [Gammaproteobacteria bacterium]|nr:hypothetical protein [Gammaproteobacteria bacterium]
MRYFYYIVKLVYLTGISLFSFHISSLYAKPLNKNFTSEFLKIENRNINESSGLSYSPQNALIWTHNDSGNAAIIYALSTLGTHIGEYLLPDFPFDWEDMSAVSIDNINYLMLADTGDNYKFRRTYRLSFYVEPKVDSKKSLNTIINLDSSYLSWEVLFKFENNKSYNIEATAVDSTSQKIYVLTKSKKKTKLFQLPLKPTHTGSGNEVVEAEFIQNMPDIKRATAMDISRDGLSAVVLVYGYVYYYQRKVDQSWKKAFSKADKIIKYPQLFQPEAICFGVDANELYLTSEKRSHLLRLKLLD